jgi:hypothetical protein
VVDRTACDALLDEAAGTVGLTNLRQRMPPDNDVVMWIDPGHVAIKNNSTGRSHTLYNHAAPVKPLTKQHRENSIVRSE